MLSSMSPTVAWRDGEAVLSPERARGDLVFRKHPIIADALSTPYHAVKNRACVRPGDTVAVFGCGSIGLLVMRCAKIAGAATLRPGKQTVALRFGR